MSLDGPHARMEYEQILRGYLLCFILLVLRIVMLCEEEH